MMRRAAAVLLLTLLAGTAAAQDGVTVSSTGRDALGQPIPALAPEHHDAFAHGRSLFRQAWLITPSAEQPELDGLGPVFNRLSCVACHVKNGRGTPPDGENDVMRTTLVRLSAPDGTPHPAYGEQLNPDSIPGVPGEGKATLVWSPVPVTLDDGTVVELRRPTLRFRDLAFGPLGDGVLTSVRMAPPVHGLGLLDAVPDWVILEAADPDGRGREGVSGRPNRIYDIASGQTLIGRFGLKANQTTLRQQIAGAFLGDIGITSPLFPTENCTGVQTACAAAANRGEPELTAAQLDAITLYSAALAVPARRTAPGAQEGEALFTAIGCAACHRPTLTTGPYPALPELADRTIHPFTDLLLHDMGPDLADGRPDGLAGGSEWRTPPLWGLGLAGVAGDGAFYLHDGRARTVTEAILWHGGEAAAARARFTALPAAARDTLLTFLGTL